MRAEFNLSTQNCSNKTSKKIQSNEGGKNASNVGGNTLPSILSSEGINNALPSIQSIVQVATLYSTVVCMSDSRCIKVGGDLNSVVCWRLRSPR